VSVGMEIRMGRWSELRVVMVCQEREGARWAEQRERSGEEGWPKEGTRVGESSLRRQRSLPFKASTSASPRLAAVLSRVRECQAGWWALKSPKRMESFGVLKSLLKLGEYCVGQEEWGGR